MLEGALLPNWFYLQNPIYQFTSYNYFINSLYYVEMQNILMAHLQNAVIVIVLDVASDLELAVLEGVQL